jgi:hypothetical protein
VTFAIEFVGERFNDELTGETLSRRGLLVLDGHEESFVAPLVLWDELQYESHWLRSLKRLLSPARRSLLVVHAWPPSGAFGEIWPCWREDDGTAFFQNWLVRMASESVEADDEVKRLDPDDLDYDLVGQRGDSADVSEWTVPVESVQKFVEAR